MLKVDHIGIAVKSLAVSIPLFEKLLDTKCYKTERVESENVSTAFFMQGETKIELLESFTPESVISRFLEKKEKVSIILHLKWLISKERLPG